MKNSLTVRDAEIKDIPGIHEMLRVYAEQQIILPRSEKDIEEHLANFVVAQWDGQYLWMLCNQGF